MDRQTRAAIQAANAAYRCLLRSAPQHRPRVYLIDGRRVLLYVGVGAGVLALIALAATFDPHLVHAAGPGRIGKAIIKHGLHSKHMRHSATRGWGATKHGLLPKRGTIGPPMSPERYLWDYLARIVRDIGHKRTAGVFPFVPPGAPGVGGGAGLPL